MTDDEKIDKLEIREEGQTQILIDQFRTENQELETKIKEMDKSCLPSDSVMSSR